LYELYVNTNITNRRFRVKRNGFIMKIDNGEEE